MGHRERRVEKSAAGMRYGTCPARLRITDFLWRDTLSADSPVPMGHAAQRKVIKADINTMLEQELNSRLDILKCFAMGKIGLLEMQGTVSPRLKPDEINDMDAWKLAADQTGYLHHTTAVQPGDDDAQLYGNALRHEMAQSQQCLMEAARAPCDAVVQFSRIAMQWNSYTEMLGTKTDQLFYQRLRSKGAAITQEQRLDMRISFGQSVPNIQEQLQAERRLPARHDNMDKVFREHFQELFQPGVRETAIITALPVR